MLGDFPIAGKIVVITGGGSGRYHHEIFETLTSTPTFTDVKHYDRHRLSIEQAGLAIKGKGTHRGLELLRGM